MATTRGPEIALIAALALAGCAHSRTAPAEKPALGPAHGRVQPKRVEKPGGRDESADLARIEAEVAPPKTSEESECAAAKATGATPSAKVLIWPVDGVVIGAFGHRDGAPHDGIDIAAPEGSAIWASADGEVVFAGEQPGYGRIVIVRHASDLVTVYAHNAKNCVKDGARVVRGEVIALVGQSGGATSPQVHFEVRIGQRAVNPYKHLPE
jgi:lipoprotein NlpD